MKRAIDETNRRRKRQEIYNKKHGITPTTIQKKISDVLSSIYEQDYAGLPVSLDEELPEPERIPKMIEQLKKQMLTHAKKLEFEKAAELRNRIRRLEQKMLQVA